MTRIVAGIGVTFQGGNKRVTDLQSVFIQQLVKARQLCLDKLTIDNTNVRENTSGIVCFMDLATSECGFSHVMPSEVLDIFKALSAIKRTKYWWWTAYHGDALPNPLAPLLCKKPW